VETIKKGFFARLKSSIGRMFKKTKKEEAAPAKEKEKVKGNIKGKVTVEKVAEEKTGMSFREIIAQFADAFTEMKANELKALPEEKKDYWWAYSIVLTIFATIALIAHMF
jgi:DNA repair exonuclease SbcCD nuclease subunit